MLDITEYKEASSDNSYLVKQEPTVYEEGSSSSYVENEEYAYAEQAYTEQPIGKQKNWGGKVYQGWIFN